MDSTRIGIIGTGRMGTAIAKRLMELGHEVMVWNRTGAATEGAAAAGAAVAGDLSALASASDVIISSLTDFDALRSVHQGAQGLLAQDIAGKLVIEMSTLLPDQQQALEGDVTGAGALYLECPVGGTVGPALKGQLLGMAGGSEAAWSRGQPILEGLCKRVEHLGPVGTGSAMKLAVNLPLALYWATLGEAMGLLKGQGVAPRLAASILSDSSGGPAVLKNRLEVVASTLEGTDQPGTFDIDGLHKDLVLALEWAARSGTAMPLSNVARGLYEQAIAQELGGYDGASLTRFLVEG